MQRVASLIRNRSNAGVPVNIVEVAAQFADIEQADWPQESVDGITINCSDPRPQIFYRGDADVRRVRFTIAHELGHAVIPWHIGTAECAMAGWSGSQRSGVERQADEFAAELLMPTDWLRTSIRQHGPDLSLVLADVESARASATASLIAVSNILPTGWALQLNNNELVFPHDYRRSMTRAQADSCSFASGMAAVHQQTIRWWRLFEIPALPEVPPDKASAYVMFDRAWGNYGHNAPARKSIDGRVSAVLGSLGGLLDIETALGYLLYRLQPLGQTDHLYSSDDFRGWLTWKAHQGASELRTWDP